jgi:hypothetical protein
MKTTKMFRHVSWPPAVESATVSVVNKFIITAFNERRGKKESFLYLGSTQKTESRPCSFTLGETANGTHKTGSCVGP